MDHKILLLIADDHQLIAKLIRNDLSNDANIKIVGVVNDGEQVIDFLNKNKVDVLMLDIAMPKMDGFQVLKAIREKNEKLNILILSNMVGGEVVTKAIRLGANGFLSKYADSEELKVAIYTLMRGEKYFCKTSFENFLKVMTDFHNKNGNNHHIEKNGSITTSSFNTIKKHVFQSDIKYDDDVCNHKDALTNREKQILQLIVEENSTKDISDKLYISTRTVETHRKNILHKYGVKNSLGLMKAVLEGSYDTSL
jgi:DNA-binding NarL/FixJ family response regulator